MRSAKTVTNKSKRADPPPLLRRTGWDEYFMGIAKVVASRSTCDRKYVGAVIVRDKTILSTGYNGSIRKLEHCSEVGHLMENGHCVATIHAEANAILQAAKNGVCIDHGAMYTTASPCWPCFKMIANSGIQRICYGEFYRDPRIFEIAKKLKIELNKVGGDVEAGVKEQKRILRNGKG
jgi:dCMP deaminase